MKTASAAQSTPLHIGVVALFARRYFGPRPSISISGYSFVPCTRLESKSLIRSGGVRVVAGSQSQPPRVQHRHSAQSVPQEESLGCPVLPCPTAENTTDHPHPFTCPSISMDSRVPTRLEVAVNAPGPTCSEMGRSSSSCRSC